MAGFVQIIEFESSRIEEFEALTQKLETEQGEALLASKATVTEDRDRPGHYVVLVEFPSYESAMENSNDPVTVRYAAEMARLVGEPVFRNLDVRSVSEFH